MEFHIDYVGKHNLYFVAFSQGGSFNSSKLEIEVECPNIINADFTTKSNFTIPYSLSEDMKIIELIDSFFI